MTVTDENVIVAQGGIPPQRLPFACRRVAERSTRLLYPRLVTDADEKLEEQTPQPVGTHYLSTLDDAIEHLRAANLLGFGVQLRSYLAPMDDAFEVRWELEVLTEPPVQADDDEDQDVSPAVS
jgi:hypothetical protein